MIHDHFTYTIVLMYDIDTICAMYFAYYNFIIVRCFLCQTKYHDLSLLLTKFIRLEAGQVYTCIG